MSYTRLAALFLLSLMVFCVLDAPGCAAQTPTDQAHFLVARRELSDPLFRESVVLMLPFRDRDLMVGLIVNKRTRVPLSELFPKDAVLKDRTDPIYFGGPVDTETESALFRSPKVFKQAVHLVGDIYVTFDSKFIKQILKKPNQVLDVRLFLGRAQWSIPQLQEEMLSGAWYADEEENNWIFSPEPENIWRTLISREEPGPRARLRIDGQRPLLLPAFYTGRPR